MSKHLQELTTYPTPQSPAPVDAEQPRPRVHPLATTSTLPGEPLSGQSTSPSNDAETRQERLQLGENPSESAHKAREPVAGSTAVPSLPTPAADTAMSLDPVDASAGEPRPGDPPSAADRPATQVDGVARPKEEDLATFPATSSLVPPSFDDAAARGAPPDGNEPPREGSSNATGRAEDLARVQVTDNEDRKPDVPPPFPFASTSKAVSPSSGCESPATAVKAEPDASASASPRGERRSTSAGAAANGSIKSGSSTPRLGASGEDNDDDEVKPPASARSKGKKKKIEDSVPQFIGDLPLAEEEAARTYTELEFSNYGSKTLGDVKYFDADEARCDCTYTPNWPLSEQACGEHSNCMNRLMQIECLEGDCRCGSHCQNQKFQRRQFAPIEIVKTEKKGFGVRAGADIPADSFVYEYVGDVIGQAVFERKIKKYAQEGIKHFYFMALDKDVFIDATKEGGKGRFLNHSCNPNCIVAKWTVGRKMRMGIFTKRDIKKDEELTFNYNVDRYGHVAQECYCGEPNCEGYIGGKTQTDLGGMDDLYIDALGIAEEVAALGLKGTKKKKGKKLDEDFTPTLHPVQLDEVPKVSAAIRQALQTRRILEKLLTRVHMTTDEEVQRNLLRLHGLNLMNNVLREYEKDIHVITLDLEILGRWRLQTRNKIESSKIEESVQKCLALEDDRVKSLANALLQSWAELQLGYRIPKALLDSTDPADRKRVSDWDIQQIAKRARLEDEALKVEQERPQLQFEGNSVGAIRVPDGWDAHWDHRKRATFFVNRFTGAQQWEVPLRPARREPIAPRVTAPIDANEIIAQAERAARAAAEAEQRRIADEKAAVEAERREKEERRRLERDEKARAQKEKKVMGLFSGVVVATMSKYRKEFEGEAFKKRAREVSEILVEKEKKRPSYATDAYDSLAPEKEAKVKSFVKDWVKKLLERRKSGRPSSSSTNTPKPKGQPEAASTGVDSPAAAATAGENATGNGHADVRMQDTPASSGTPPV